MAVLLSIALQHGVPLETIKHALTREGNGTPSTIIGAVVDRLTGQAEDESAQAERKARRRGRSWRFAAAIVPRHHGDPANLVKRGELEDASVYG